MTNPEAKLTKPELKLVLLLAAINCVQITDALLMAPLAKALQDQLLMSVEQYSFTVAIYGFAAAVCGLLSSAFIDRFDRRFVILLAFGGLIVSFVCSALAIDFTTLLIARLAAGMTGGLTTCATLAVVGDVIPEERRGSALGLLQAAFAVAAVIGLPLCFLLSVLTKTFATAFGGVAVFGVLVMVWAVRKLPKVKPEALAGGHNILQDLRRVFAVPNHLLSFVFMMCVSLGSFVVINYMALYMELNCGVGGEQFTVIFIAMGLCSLGAAMVSGKLTDRLGKKPVFVGSMILLMVAVGIVTNLPVVPMWVAGLAACFFMATAVARLVPTHSIMLAAASPECRGAYTTVYNSVSHLGTSVGPLIAGQIVSREGDRLMNYPIAGAVAIGCSVLGIVLAFFVKPASASR
jgi:MFS transporter, DHA1 family, inner membrane transport protein